MTGASYSLCWQLVTRQPGIDQSETDNRFTEAADVSLLENLSYVWEKDP